MSLSGKYCENICGFTTSPLHLHHYGQTNETSVIRGDVLIEEDSVQNKAISRMEHIHKPHVYNKYTSNRNSEHVCFLVLLVSNMNAVIDGGISKNFRTESITKYTLTTIHTR